MSHHLFDHLKVWTVLGTAKIAALGLDELNTLASVFALLCGGLASLSIVYWHVFKRKS